jgi:hypothetical protein
MLLKDVPEVWRWDVIVNALLPYALASWFTAKEKKVGAYAFHSKCAKVLLGVLLEVFPCSYRSLECGAFERVVISFGSRFDTADDVPNRRPPLAHKGESCR